MSATWKHVRRRAANVGSKALASRLGSARGRGAPTPPSHAETCALREFDASTRQDRARDRGRRGCGRAPLMAWPPRTLTSQSRGDEVPRRRGSARPSGHAVQRLARHTFDRRLRTRAVDEFPSQSPRQYGAGRGQSPVPAPSMARASDSDGASHTAGTCRASNDGLSPLTPASAAELVARPTSFPTNARSAGGWLNTTKSLTAAAPYILTSLPRGVALLG